MEPIVYKLPPQFGFDLAGIIGYKRLIDWAVAERPGAADLRRRAV